MVGPTWQGLWGSARQLTDGSSVTADEAYIIESIREPAVQLVEGFAPVMIPYEADLVSDDDLAALVAYLREETSPQEEAAEE